MQLEMIRRYPVKAMGGEFLDRVTLDERGLLRRLTQERAGRLAVYADVVTPGAIAVGDRADVSRLVAAP